MQALSFLNVSHCRFLQYPLTMETDIECIVVGAIETNCWLCPLEAVPGPQGRRPCVVIDPGDEAAAIVFRLGELRWFPRYILLTHGHLDHLAALPALLRSYANEKPKVGIHRLDARYLGENSLAVHRESFSAAGGNPAFVDALWEPLPEADLLFEEGDAAGPFRLLHLPGHSPGSAGFYDEKANVLFSGDTLFRDTWGRTDLPGGNETEIRRSLRRLLSMKKETRVFPGHDAETTVREASDALLRTM